MKTIDCNTLTSTASRSLGPELVGHHIWQQLQLPDILKQCGLSVRQIALAAAVVIGRLIRPASDFSTWNWIRDHSSITELTGYPVSRIGKDAVYEIADELLRHKAVLEQHLFGRERQPFPDRQSLYLFDLTNFYFLTGFISQEFCKPIWRQSTPQTLIKIELASPLPIIPLLLLPYLLRHSR